MLTAVVLGVIGQFKSNCYLNLKSNKNWVSLQISNKTVVAVICQANY